MYSYSLFHIRAVGIRPLNCRTFDSRAELCYSSLGKLMKDNHYKHILSLLALTSTFLCIFSCAKEKWEGKIYKEQGVTIVENNGAGLWGEGASEKVQFIEDLSIGEYEGEDHLMFVRYLSIAVDSELNLYILDRGNHRLLKFDREGNFLWQTGRKGQGPGEFQYPGDIALTPSKEVALRDSSFIHFFTKDGKYQKTIKLMGSFMNFTILPDGRYLAAKMVRGQLGVAAEYYSPEGKLLKQFPDEYRYGPKFSWVGAWYGGEFKLYENKLFLSLPCPYEIREYDLEGKALTKIRRDLEIKPPEVETKGNSITFHASDVSGPCFFYLDEMMVNLVSLVEKRDEEKLEFKRFLDFFNQKWQYLGSYKLPEGKTLAAIDSEGNFYFIQWEPYSKVIRSQMVLF